MAKSHFGCTEQIGLPRKSDRWDLQGAVSGHSSFEMINVGRFQTQACRLIVAAILIEPWNWAGIFLNTRLCQPAGKGFAKTFKGHFQALPHQAIKIGCRSPDPRPTTTRPIGFHEHADEAHARGLVCPGIESLKDAICVRFHLIRSCPRLRSDILTC